MHNYRIIIYAITHLLRYIYNCRLISEEDRRYHPELNNFLV